LFFSNATSAVIPAHHDDWAAYRSKSSGEKGNLYKEVLPAPAVTPYLLCANEVCRHNKRIIMANIFLTEKKACMYLGLLIVKQFSPPLTQSVNYLV